LKDRRRRRLIFIIAFIAGTLMKQSRGDETVGCLRCWRLVYALMSLPRPFPSLYPRLQLHPFVRNRNPSLATSSQALLRADTTIPDTTRPPASEDAKNMSDIDRDELAFYTENTRIASYGSTFLRPPGLDLAVPPGYYADQEQTGSPTQIVDETFVQEEDEEGFILTEEGDNFAEEGEEEYEQVSTRWDVIGLIVGSGCRYRTAFGGVVFI